MSPKLAIPLALFLVTPHNPSLLSQDSCLKSNFYGNYRDGNSVLSVLSPSQSCLDVWSSHTLATKASIAPAFNPVQQLVWLEEAAVDDTLKAQAQHFQDPVNALLDTLSSPLPLVREGPNQGILTSSERYPNFELLYRSPTAALVSISHERAKSIDQILPRFWRSTLVPTKPVSFRPVPPAAVEHVERVLATLAFNPDIASIVSNISVAQMRNDIRFLTGEDGKSGIISRHSFSPGARTAATWLRDRFEDTGAECEVKHFRTGFSPNVVCRYMSAVKTTATVLISAHYDSRGSFGSTRAPGGDDDGSGVTGLLGIARTISRRSIRFHSNVELVAFAGEEQGLVGSRAYSKELRAAGANLTLVIQADMIAYRAPGEPAQLGLPDLIGTPQVAQLVANVSALYSPELQVGFTTACCSDHQSFHEQGFPATQVFERAGPIADPMYHNSGDLSDRAGYDFGQLKSIAKVQFATILHTAGYEISY